MRGPCESNRLLHEPRYSISPAGSLANQRQSARRGDRMFDNAPIDKTDLALNGDEYISTLASTFRSGPSKMQRAITN